MTLAYSSAAQRFEAARQAYEAGRPADAVRLLDAVLQSDPRSAPALHLMGLSLTALQDLGGAERALRASLSADKRRPAVLAALGEVLKATGRSAEAEKTYRTALSIDRRHLGSVAGLAELMLGQGRAQEALQLTTPLVAGQEAPPAALSLHAEALKQLGRNDEALAFARRGVEAGHMFGELEVCGLLREMGRYEEAEASARRALETIGEHPTVLTVLGRALQDLGRYDEAEAAYRNALTRSALDPLAHQSLAELLWARTADPERAATPLDSVLRQRPTPHLLALRAKLYTRAGKPEDALGLLTEALRHAPDDPLLRASAATAAVHAGEAEAGLEHAERANALAPGVARIEALLGEACMAAGRPERAAEIARRLLKARPNEQQHLAMLAMAWRAMGDPRYRQLYDYETMVRAFTLPTPEGWSGLDAFLGDLAATLKAMHAMRGDPLDQSLRKGVQTEQNLALSPDPVLQAFFKAVDEPVGDYVRGLGKGEDALRVRNTGRHRVKTAWSVKLEPDGFHVDHLHPDGWISSAFYVELPGVMQGAGAEAGREGWIKFGEPGAPTRPKMEAEHFVRPEPGRLVLFPSYMWHGTVPFSGDQTRLTMAFDVVPG